MTMVETETLLTRRAEIADEISETITRLGVLLRQEVELQDQLRRAAEAGGSRTNPFSTTPDITDAVCGELTRVGLALRRSDPRVRVGAVIESQNRRYRNQMAGREPVAGKAVA
jgi:hypothetical protein